MTAHGRDMLRVKNTVTAAYAKRVNYDLDEETAPPPAASTEGGKGGSRGSCLTRRVCVGGWVCDRGTVGTEQGVTAEALEEEKETFEIEVESIQVPETVFGGAEGSKSMGAMARLRAAQEQKDNS